MTDPLSPAVRALVERVSIRVARSATVEQIRELAEKAAADARHNTLTVAEIRQLADVAMERARQVEVLVSRLTTLLDEVDAP